MQANPIGIDAPTIAPVLYAMVEEDEDLIDMKCALIAYGGKFTMSLSWVYSMLGKWGLRRRRGTNAARKLPADYDHQRFLFNLRLAYLVRTEAVRRGWPPGTKIPKSLIGNWYVHKSMVVGRLALFFLSYVVDRVDD